MGRGTIVETIRVALISMIDCDCQKGEPLKFINGE
jgi:hypothetical protein